MAPNEKLAELSEAGVAVWLDDLSHDRIRSGDLQSLADDYSVVGISGTVLPKQLPPIPGGL
jgi:transaldolase